MAFISCWKSFFLWQQMQLEHSTDQIFAINPFWLLHLIVVYILDWDGVQHSLQFMQSEITLHQWSLNHQGNRASSFSLENSVIRGRTSQEEPVIFPKDEIIKESSPPDIWADVRSALPTGKNMPLLSVDWWWCWMEVNCLSASL